jgi:plasmid maintenance system antidote protein VapI
LSPDLAYRLALYFDMSPEFWTNMQSSFELNAIFHTRIQELRQQVRTRAA